MFEFRLREHVLLQMRFLTNVLLSHCFGRSIFIFPSTLHWWLEYLIQSAAELGELTARHYPALPILLLQIPAIDIVAP